MKKIPMIITKIIKNKIIQLLAVILTTTLSITILDLGLRYISNQYQFFYGWTHLAPILFTLSWIFFFLMIIYLLPKKIRIIFYTVILITLNIYTFAEILHLKILGRFFGIYDIFLASEGTNYIMSALKMTNIKMILLILTSVILSIITIIIMKYQTEYKRTKKYYIIIVITGLSLFLGFRFFAISRLGEAAQGNGFEITTTPKNIYNDFNNPSKNMEVAGLLEKPVREIFLYLKDIFQNNKEIYKEKAIIHFSEREKLVNENEMTGIFKDKNLIFIMLESIDDWLVTEEVMPTLKNLEQTGWNFTSRYAPSFGGGMTFNTEYAANTGTYSLNNGMAAYNFDNNAYPYALPNLFVQDSYQVNSLHANNGSFYNRNSIHLSLGYKKHYSLRDIKLNTKDNYFLDSTLVKDDELYRYIVPETGKFMSFVITYTAHMPYSKENNKCSTNPYNLDVKDDEALSCIRNLAKDTDEFLKILIEKLKNENKLDDTVLVLFSDHYTYAYDDQDYVMEKKVQNDTNLMQNIPFIIWSNKIESKVISTIMDTADILPTVANLFGLSKYNSNNYLSTDVFSKNHEPYVYFSDSSWYDGSLYYQGQEVPKELEEYVNKISESVMTKIEINDNMLLGDYYR